MSKKPSDTPPRKSRLLSEEDRALWQEVTKSAKPLKRAQRVMAIKAAERAALANHAAQVPHKDRANVDEAPRSEPRPSAVKSKANAAKPAPALATMDRRTRARVARGDKDIAARIDLHGMTQEQAHIALQRFVHRAHDDSLGLVLVITGKGRMADDNRERGVLRRQVPLWLAMADLRPLVIGFEEAHVAHGGTGALYVRVRKRRR